MAALEWTEPLVLDLPLMDDTHREFVDLLAAVEQAGDDQVLPAWQLVGSYAPRMAYAVYAPGPHIPPKLRALVDYLQEQASASLSPSGGHNLVES